MKMEQLLRKSPFSFSEAPVTQLGLGKGSHSFHNCRGGNQASPQPHAKANISIQKQNSNPSIDGHIPSSDFPPYCLSHQGHTGMLSSYLGTHQPRTAEAAPQIMQAGGSQGSAAFLWSFPSWQHLRLFLNNFFILFSAILWQLCGCNWSQRGQFGYGKKLPSKSARLSPSPLGSGTWWTSPSSLSGLSLAMQTCSS